MNNTNIDINNIIDGVIKLSSFSLKIEKINLLLNLLSIKAKEWLIFS